MGAYGQEDFVNIKNLSFRMYSDEEIKKISVMRITNPESFNDLGHIAPGGLYDLSFGPIGDEHDLCTTCRLRSNDCAGHCGHVELPLPVYNPVFYSTLRKIVSQVCFHCHRFVSKAEKVIQLDYQVKLLEKGFYAEALQLDDFVSQVISCAEGLEADEVSVNVENKVVEEKKKWTVKSPIIRALKKKLESHVAEIFLKGNPQNLATSNQNAVRDEILNKFWYDNRPSKNCTFCDRPMIKLTLQNSRFMKKSTNVSSKKVIPVDEEDDDDLEESIQVDSQSFLTPKQIQVAIRKSWQSDKEVLLSLYPVLNTFKMEYPTDMFFIQTLLVIPPKFRPYRRMREGFITEHESAPVLKNVIKLSLYMAPLISLMNGVLEKVPVALQKFYDEITGKSHVEKCQNMWYQIQTNVDNLFDATQNATKKITSKGIRQVLEKKAGLLRHNLMGKRVNFSARSVAAPDPHIGIDEVGVPMDFAIKLSYPISVTEWNVEEMRKLVMNGPKNYPGALFIETEEGKKIHLDRLDENDRTALAKTLLTPVESQVKKVNAQKIIHRQLKNGDYVLMNRQPTLHRPSIQAHRARVMKKDRVLRMPYANCKAYNADFDGDEFNMHFPQDELARSESEQLIMTYNSYLTPKDGSPLAGLIQDCVVSSVKITIRNKFFNREDYHQLVYASLPDHVGKIECLPSCILKPQQLWSGKQVISTLINNVIPSGKAKPSFQFKTSVKVDIWQTAEARPWRGGGDPEKRRESMTESEFVMRNGELLCGVVDKCAIGSTGYGLIHTCYDLYGGPIAYKLLTAINRLCVYYLQWVGHTITVKDFITPKHVSKKRTEALQELLETAPDVVETKLNLHKGGLEDHFEMAHMSKNDKNMAGIDAAYTSALGQTTSRVTSENERQLFRPNLDNHMKMMVDTGAKGSKVNMNQMASLFGSLAIDGKRMPISITGKALPSFKPYDRNPCSGGYIPNRFMTSINPKAFFFLGIVGRDSLQHTAVKTANSGYVQRCLIKHLEGICVSYDHTVRNSDGLVLQFNYGEDGLDVTKVPFMSSLASLDVLVNNYSRLLDERSIKTAMSVSNQEQIQDYLRRFRIKRKKNLGGDNRDSGFLRFCKKFASKIESTGLDRDAGRSKASMKLQELWHTISSEEKQKYNEKVKKKPDPVDSVFSGSANLGVVSEALDTMIDNYYNNFYSKQPQSSQKLSKEEVERTIHMKALKSKVDPGEAVGALCAQSLGEPLTQMTLNTFHFAGKDELNVTLGVPRMIEILRTGVKNISTPIMEVPFYPHVSKNQAEKLRLLLSEVSIAKVLHTMNVVSKISSDSYGKVNRIMRIKLNFLPHKHYKKTCSVKPPDILRYVEKYFLKNILKCIIQALKKDNIKCTTKQDKEKPKSQEETEEKEEEEHPDNEQERRVEEEDLDESSDEDDADEGDAKAATRRQDYSDDEDSVSLDGEEDINGTKNEVPVVEDDVELVEPKAKKYENTIKKRKKYEVTNMEAMDRIECVKVDCQFLNTYDFDRVNQQWCEAEFQLPVADDSYDIVSIVRELSERSYIRNIPGIRRVFVVEKDDILMLRTEGVNVLKLYAYEHLLNVNKLYTNNIYQVAEMYGIEAAQRSIIREIRAVTSAYDIKVDFRHLSLLSDYFTCEGIYKACSRHSIKTCASPMQKMTFETTTEFLRVALLHCEKEPMESPSSNIAVGQPPIVGTNSMHVRHTPATSNLCY